MAGLPMAGPPVHAVLEHTGRWGTAAAGSIIVEDVLAAEEFPTGEIVRGPVVTVSPPVPELRHGSSERLLDHARKESRKVTHPGGQARYPALDAVHQTDQSWRHRRAALPTAVVQPIAKTPYSYGFFGATPPRQWTRHEGYRDRNKTYWWK